METEDQPLLKPRRNELVLEAWLGLFWLGPSLNLVGGVVVVVVAVLLLLLLVGGGGGDGGDSGSV